MKKVILTYTISIIVAIGIVLMVCGISGVLTTEMEQKEVVRYVCDGFFVSAILFICVGVLSWTSRDGVFDGIGYAFYIFKQRYVNVKRSGKYGESYSEYKERVREKKGKGSFGHLFIIGGVFAVVTSVLFLVYTLAF